MIHHSLSLFDGIFNIFLCIAHLTKNPHKHIFSKILNIVAIESSISH